MTMMKIFCGKRCNCFHGDSIGEWLIAEAKSVLLKTVITEISNTGAELINIAFDGLVTNFTTCKQFCASFNMNEFRPFFPNPVGGRQIKIILDPCHMLKLARNCLENERFTYDGDGRKIELKHFESLESQRDKNDFVMHKLNKKHIQCQRNKMNVMLAAQTLSDSVANSLEYLMKEERRREMFYQLRWNYSILSYDE